MSAPRSGPPVVLALRYRGRGLWGADMSGFPGRPSVLTVGSAARVCEWLADRIVETERLDPPPPVRPDNVIIGPWPGSAAPTPTAPED